ncbi:hypothetical protein [Xanthomonas floridensis]|nr:hypothetical protein [Xanthomonas floridensis]MEA5125795.1 hypothetical protein [Xanthomonas floridensis]MEA5133462.1 hypothetical protein [Xanthomonas floridensis]
MHLSRSPYDLVLDPSHTWLTIHDLVLSPSHTWLTIHESVGHPLELDRVLGHEANDAGTSFATLDKLKAGFLVRASSGRVSGNG